MELIIFLNGGTTILMDGPTDTKYRALTFQINITILSRTAANK